MLIGIGIGIGAGGLVCLLVAGEDWHRLFAGTHVRRRTRTDVNVGRVGARAC